MFGRPRLKLNAGGRRMALAAAAVALPVLILSAVQYRSLAELQDKTEIAAREDLRRALQSVSRRAEERLVGAAREVLSASDSEELRSADPRQLEERFGEARRRHPFVERVFVVSHCDCREKFALISRPDGVSRVGPQEFGGSHELRHVTEDFEAATRAPAAAASGHEFIFWQARCAHCGPGGAAGDRIYVFKPLREQGGEAPYGFAAFTLNPDHLRHNFFADLAPGAAHGDGPEGLAFGVYDEAGAEVLSGGDGVSYEARTPLGPALPGWTLAAGYRGATAAALARANFRVGLLLTASVLCCLALGVALMLRTALSEVRLAEAKSAFVSNVSHELKTPLALIRLFAETLELGRVRDDEKAREYCRVISRESGRLTGLIDNVLDFAQIEAGRKRYHLARADAGEVVAEAVRDYEYRLEAAGFGLRLDVGPGLPAVMADRGALAQAVVNLLDNAVRYSPGGGEVGVRVSARAGEVVVEVADRGIGIPRSEHGKIFEKFYRVGDGLVHDVKGSGLGLSLVRHVVRAHGGRVTLDSAPGRGSRFRIHLPAAPPESRQAETTLYAEGAGVAANPHR